MGMMRPMPRHVVGQMIGLRPDAQVRIAEVTKGTAGGRKGGILFYSTVLGWRDVRIPQKHHPKEFNAQIAETNSLSGAKYYRLRY
jgi:hypothetical protein